MSSDSNLGVRIGSYLAGNTLNRFIPEPKTSPGISFRSVLNTVGSLAGVASGGAVSGLDPNYAALIEKQIEVQQQMMLMSMHSNIEKSKHETQMAAVRNLRAG